MSQDPSSNNSPLAPYVEYAKGILTPLLELAKRIPVRLSFLAFAILALVVMFLYAFSQGSWDQIIRNSDKLNGDQILFLIIVLALGFFVIFLTTLSIFGRTVPHVSEPKITAIVHNEGDKTSVIGNARVTLQVPPEPIHKFTESNGAAILYFPAKLIGKHFLVNADAEGYEHRKGTRIKLGDNQIKYIGLRAKQEQANMSVLPRMQYYIYLSDSKIEMLVGQKGNIASQTNRYHALDSILHDLQSGGQIGNLTSNKPYIFGDFMMRWGVINLELPKRDAVTFFFCRDTNPIILMAGSVSHVIASPKETTLFSGIPRSALPGIMQAIKFSVEHDIANWADGVGGIDDYLFALGFVHEKVVDRAGVRELQAIFTEQKLTFVASRLKRLGKPSEQELRTLLRGNPRLDENDREQIFQLVAKAADILICSPLYVALSEEKA